MSTPYRRTWSRVTELRRLIDDVVDADWRHPSWWLLCSGAALLEGRAPGRDAGTPGDDVSAVSDHYIHSDGGPRADTFMGRILPAPSTLSERVAGAILCARAGLAALDRFDGQFPGQPLRCCLARRGSGWQPVALGNGREQTNRVAFVTARGAALATLDKNPAHNARMAADLASFARGQPAQGTLTPIDPESLQPTPAALAVTLGDEPQSAARHLHRRAWTRGGGPWLGIGSTGNKQIVTTCHLIVDGYGHTCITTAVLTGHDELATQHLARLVGAALPPDPLSHDPAPPMPRFAGAAPLGMATGLLPNTDFATLAHALGAALEVQVRGHQTPAERRAFRFTPGFQVPVVPGERTDPERWRRRVIPALMSVRMHRGELEPLAAFRARVPHILTRECAAQGLLGRLRDAAVRAPMTTQAKRRMVSSAAVPRPWLPPVEALAGRSCLSILRLPLSQIPATPLFAVSAPAMDPSPKDPRGSNVVTVIAHTGGLAVTVSGTGDTGTDHGAQAFLETWREHLARVTT